MRKFLFQFDGFWEKDVVFEVDVLVQILLELLEYRHRWPPLPPGRLPGSVPDPESGKLRATIEPRVRATRSPIAHTAAESSLP